MKELIAALAKARAEFPEIPKDKSAEIPTKRGGRIKFGYSSLTAINKAVTHILSNHGLVIVQIIQESDQRLLKTILCHESGDTIESEIALPEVHDMKELGGALTYLRRYAISSILNISSDEDTDVSAFNPPVASKRQPQKPNPNKERFGLIMERTEHTAAQVRQILTGLPPSKDMNLEQVMEARDRLYADWAMSQEVFPAFKAAANSLAKMVRDELNGNGYDDALVWDTWETKVGMKKAEEVKQ